MTWPILPTSGLPKNYDQRGPYVVFLSGISLERLGREDWRQRYLVQLPYILHTSIDFAFNSRLSCWLISEFSEPELLFF